VVNVLLTCAGRRHYLVQYFREALAGRGAVCAADCYPAAPAMLAADAAFTLPPVGDPRYHDLLLDVCRQSKVGLLIPLNDLELPAIAAWRGDLLGVGTIAMIASPEAIDICADKWRSYEFLALHGLRTPRTYLSLADAVQALHRGDLRYPVVVKPRWGSASLWLELCRDDEELELAYRLVKRRAARRLGEAGGGAEAERCVLIQQWLRGHEYGLDVVNDLSGRHVCTFARQKLVMRAGETDRAVTVEDEELSDLGRKLGEAFAHAGNLDCDVFLEERGPCVVDLNPRFGGGYPFSHVAGADLPAALVAWAEGRAPDPRWFTATPGVMSAKCDQLVVRKLRAPAAGDAERADAVMEERR
jgi:carbamoyl-phosphate synthase large subunit